MSDEPAVLSELPLQSQLALETDLRAIDQMSPEQLKEFAVMLVRQRAATKFLYNKLLAESWGIK